MDDQVFAYLSGRPRRGPRYGDVRWATVCARWPHPSPRSSWAYLRTVPPTSSRDLPAVLAPPASDSHRQGPQIADTRGKQVRSLRHCHSWSGVSPIAPTATLTGARAVNDPSAINVAQVVLSGAVRRTPQGALSMPAFGNAYSDAEIAAVANYVTARFGSKPSSITEKQVADLRKQTAQD